MEETKLCYKELKEAHEAGVDYKDPRQSTAVVVHLEALQRNKRCALAFLRERARRIEVARWEVGRYLPKPMRDRLSATEVQYAAGYSKILEGYQRSLDMDLTTDMAPPRAYMVEIRVLEDCGEIVTDSGPVNLAKNTTHFIRRHEIESFIRQGMVEEIGH